MSRAKQKQKLNNLIRAYFIKSAKANANGELLCPLKKRYYPANEMEVAHFIDRRHYCTRYTPTNLLLVSKASNTYECGIPAEGYESKHHKEYEEFIGKEAADKLRAASEGTCKQTEVFLEVYIELYEKMLN